MTYSYDQLNLTFEQANKKTVHKAIARFRQNANYLAFAGIKIPPGSAGDADEINADIIAAICRAWLEATEEPPMKRVEVDWRDKP